jgi:serine protease Do
MKTERSKTICLITIQFLLCCFLQVTYAASVQNTDIDLLKRTGDAIAQIAQTASPAVVSVRIEKIEGTSGFFGNEGGQMQDPFEQFFKKFFGPNQFPGQQFQFQFPQPQQPQQQIIKGLGSGFIVESSGYIITNNHVVSGAEKVVVKLLSGNEYKAKVLGTDPPTDLALVKIDADNLPTLEFGDSDMLKVGQWVIAIGNPFGLTSTVTVGVVSAKGRSGIGIEDYEDFIQTDAAINLGNSGGPLLSADGKVIGINTAIVSSSGGSVGIGFAIPSNMAKIIYEQLRNKGHVTRGFLGIVIQQITPDLAKYFHLTSNKGILVSEVSKDSPAEKAGIKQGDVITAINGHPTEKIAEFRNYVAMQAPGTKAELTIIRNGKEEKLALTIGEAPSSAKQKVVGAEEGSKIGLTVQNLTDELAASLGYKGLHGVVITQVDPGSPADEAGLKSGMLIMQVNQKPVENVDEFQAEVKTAAEKGSILLLVRSKNYTEYLVIKLK